MRAPIHLTGSVLRSALQLKEATGLSLEAVVARSLEAYRSYQHIIDDAQGWSERKQRREAA